ncbi:MAG: hypothetical protein Q9170_001159 [Blastenia crenularia]
MSSHWKLLRHSSSANHIPPLLVKYEFGKSNYKIWLTDIQHVWAEVVGQRPLVQRAWDIDADIDPIESDQRQMLLQRIQDSLNEVRGTKLAISRKDNLQGIVLTACCPLPEPLKQLRWPFYLAPTSGQTLSNELVLPLLGEQLLFRKKVTSLLASLKDKDRIISKLTDKMQAEGIELDKVFPGTTTAKSNRKGNSREDIGNLVQGLGLFNEAHWESQFAHVHEVPQSCSGILSELFSHSASLVLTKIDEQSSDSAWWEYIDTGGIPQDDESEGTIQSRSQGSTAHEFQRQPTPDHLKKSAAQDYSSPTKMTLPERGSNPKPSALGNASDGSTTESSDEDLDSVKPKPQQARQSPKPIVEHSSSSSKSGSPEPAGKANQNQSPKLKGVLGRIGGAAKPDVSSSKPRLGQIGGMRSSNNSSQPASESPDARGRSPALRTSSSPPRESSRERADIKREQLKRELEEKSRHGGKKKRKF